MAELAKNEFPALKVSSSRDVSVNLEFLIGVKLYDFSCSFEYQLLISIWKLLSTSFSSNKEVKGFEVTDP